MRNSSLCFLFLDKVRNWKHPNNELNYRNFLTKNSVLARLPAHKCPWTLLSVSCSFRDKTSKWQLNRNGSLRSWNGPYNLRDNFSVILFDTIHPWTDNGISREKFPPFTIHNVYKMKSWENVKLCTWSYERS